MPAYKGKWNLGWTKSGAILPEKINGKYLDVLSGGRRWTAYADVGRLLQRSGALDRGAGSSSGIEPPAHFDSTVVEPGPAPFMTEKGIFLIYNGADDKSVYRAGWVVFDKTIQPR